MNNNEVIKYVKELKKDTSNHTFYVVEDLSILEFAMKDNLVAEEFIYVEEMCYSDLSKKVLDYFKKHSKNNNSVTKKLYERVVDKNNAQGMIAVFRKKDYVLDDYKNAKNILVLDGIETPGNIGTMIRTCDACNVDLIIVTNEVARVFNPKVMQASRGMQLFVPIIESSYEETQKFLLENNFDIFLAEPKEGKHYQEYDYKNKNVIVVGSERYGIDKRYFSQKHNKIYIPMIGKMTSLNVGVSASIIIYEAFMRQKY